MGLRCHLIIGSSKHVQVILLDCVLLRLSHRCLSVTFATSSNPKEYNQGSGFGVRTTPGGKEGGVFSQASNLRNHFSAKQPAKQHSTSPTFPSTPPSHPPTPLSFPLMSFNTIYTQIQSHGRVVSLFTDQAIDLVLVFSNIYRGLYTEG